MFRFELRAFALAVLVAATLPTAPTSARASEAAIVEFNHALSGRPNYIWMRTQWTFDEPGELRRDRHFLLADELEKSGFLTSSTTVNPPHAEREEYWRRIEEDRQKECDELKRQAEGQRNGFGMPKLVICGVGTYRNRLSEERIPRNIITFTTTDPSQTLRTDGILKMFLVGTIDEIRVIEAVRSAPPGCDWQAQTRTWFKPETSPGLVLSAIQRLTGRDSYDQRNCYFLDRDGVKWKLANPILD